MWPVLKKELKSYFLSPIGYICIGIYSNCSPASAKVIFVYIFNDITESYVCHPKVC